MLLSSLPPHPCGNVELEQYSTSGDIAASWLAQIIAFGDLSEDSSIVDLGAGNGVLGVGAALMGVSQVVLVRRTKKPAQWHFSRLSKQVFGFSGNNL